MSAIQPQGESLRKAVKWIGQERKSCSDKKANPLINKACIKFNLSPKDAEFLSRFITEA